MLQSSTVPHGPDVWLCGHLHAVLQREGDGHSAECRGVSRHWPGHWDPVWPCDYVGPQCGTVYGGPASGPAGWSGFSCGEEKLKLCFIKLLLCFIQNKTVKNCTSIFHVHANEHCNYYY